MSTVEETIKINAPVQRVWDTVMDPSRFVDWVTIHRSVKSISPQPLAPGATMDQVLCLRGVNFTVHWTLAEVNPPRTACWEGRGPAHSRALIRYQLTAEGDDATTFSYTNEFHPPGGPLGNVASRVFVGDLSEREAHKSLFRLKDLLESH
ncbi:MAG TPA: SRPBCC family protein [Solirubrobacteraceae bacterium]|nr:SRPBCC family protein [Solirubrobacteraceae bacterium]